MNCRNIITLAKKELWTFSNAPAFYGIALFFTLFSSVWFFYIQQFFAQNAATLRSYFVVIPILFILVIPVITMKSWAEERKLGSIELLLTLPYSEWELALGKFTASFAMVGVLLLLTLPVPLSVAGLGTFDAGVIFGEYLGVLLLGASASALGLLLSSLSKNQAGAFLGSVSVMLLTMAVSRITAALELPTVAANALNFLSLSFHFESFARGVLDTRDAAFFIISTVLFLFLNTRVIIFRKWR